MSSEHSTAAPAAQRPHHATHRPPSGARPLRIGWMLRGMGEVDGAGVYLRQICDALLALDRTNEYVLLYRHPEQLGQYAHYPNVRERLVRAPGKLLWDQVAVPLVARRERLDVIFHHKFSVPLLAPCPTVVQQRCAEYWLFPHFYDRLNRVYNTASIPIYCRSAERVLTNSDSLADELSACAGIPRERMHTVYAAANARFAPVTEAARLRAVRERYGLPEGDFLLMVAKGYARIGKSGQPLYPSKNILGTLEGYARARRSAPCPPVVIVGAGIRERLEGEPLSRELGSAVQVPGLLAHEDMPALYSMARALVFPSVYESFGIPIIEAMSCGCPVITSSRGACAEVSGDAALLVDPDDTAALAAAIVRVSADDALRQTLQERGLARAARFSWEESARQLLGELSAAAASRPR